MERLGDYLPIHRRGMLGRIYLSKQLTEALPEIAVGSARVVISARTVTIYCDEPAYAKRLSLERRKLEAILGRLAGKGHGLTLKIRVSG